MYVYAVHSGPYNLEGESSPSWWVVVKATLEGDEDTIVDLELFFETFESANNFKDKVDFSPDPVFINSHYEDYPDGH